MDHQFFLIQLIDAQEKETYSNTTKKEIEIFIGKISFLQAFFLVELQVNLVHKYELYPQDI
jgi:hypothetical protein